MTYKFGTKDSLSHVAVSLKKSSKVDLQDMTKPRDHLLLQSLLDVIPDELSR